MNNENSKGMTRRNLALGAGLVSAAVVTSKGRAQTGTTTSANDIAVLNYALALEHLEAAFYTRALGQFTAESFNQASFAPILGSGTVQGVYTNLTRIRDHEVAHVTALQQAITALGGTPVAACTYRFPYTTVDQFLQVAETLEETGVMAYNGAIGQLQDRQLMAAGAGITTVEARHAAYLKLVNSNIPFPKAFDEARMMSEILAMVAPYTDVCASAPPTNPTNEFRAVLNPKNLVTALPQLQLDASSSTSGTDEALASYMIRAVQGTVAITGANTARPTVFFQGGMSDYIFELTVTNAAGQTMTDRTTIRYMGQ